MSRTEFRQKISANHPGDAWIWEIVERYEKALILYATRLTGNAELA